MQAMAFFFAIISLFMCGLLLLHIRAPLGFMALFPKLAAGALSPLWCLLGLTGAILGWMSRAPLAVGAGGLAALGMAAYILAVIHPRSNFEEAFGAGWRRTISSEQKKGSLKHPWAGVMLDPPKPPCWERDLPFWTIPGSDRKLLCDLWQPPEGISSSGLALIFFHGSAWSVFDKDLGTRPFFRHLIAQGHVVMDVSYRLCPEVDLFDMVGDVKRAVAWMKANASRYTINPQRIVLGGGSAGGHLSMLAGFAPSHPRLTPDELHDVDLSVRGVVSLYGPSDLRAVYEHTQQFRLVGQSRVPIGQQSAGVKKNAMRDAGRLDILLGGHPDEVPEAYDLGSPVYHVHPGCPPTLLIQGEHDLITPVGATRTVAAKLAAAGVPVVNIVYPCTDHAFDLIVPRISPAAQSAIYAIERFLALLA
jgi:acetyl esterase/lipase